MRRPGAHHLHDLRRSCKVGNSLVHDDAQDCGGFSPPINLQLKDDELIHYDAALRSRHQLSEILDAILTAIRLQQPSSPLILCSRAAWLWIPLT